ncbi:putative DEAD-box ATP-dependent RNA helicase 33 [Bienertia sinuspersici]
MQILQTSLIQNPNPTTLSFSTTLSTTSPLSVLPKLSSLSLIRHRPSPSTVIRNGGGPRTFPGGVSKWQWKRMQAKKSKQLLKARLSRERNIYEMRKRAELKAAVSNLERPWDLIQKGPSSSSLFSVSADEQLKVLADRFQKPGGFDLWSDNDGPQIFRTSQDLPSARFFPKGVVHSVKPYGGTNPDSRRNLGFEEKKELALNSNRTSFGAENSNSNSNYEGRTGKLKERIDNKDNKEVQGGDDELRKINRNRGRHSSGVDRNGKNLMDVRRLERTGVSKRNRRVQNSSREVEVEVEDVYDMSLQGDGTYGFSGSKRS